MIHVVVRGELNAIPKIKNRLWFALELASAISFIIVITPRVFCYPLNERALGSMDSLEPVMN